MSRIEAIPSYVPERGRDILIDSDTLFYYLIGDLLDQPVGNLDSKLDLSAYTVAFKNIHRESNIVFRYSEKEINGNNESNNYFHPLLDTLIANHAKEKAERKKRRKAQGEVGSLVFYDRVAGRQLYTPVVKGKYNQVVLNYEFIADRMSAGLAYTTLEVHSHPYDAPFSPIDFTRMLTKKNQYNRSLKGSVLLCPNIQLLALSTDKTPMYDSFDDVKNRIKEMTATFRDYQNTMVADSQRKYYESNKTLDKHLLAIQDTMIPQLDELSAMREKYKMTDDEVRDAILMMIFHNDPEFKSLNDENDRLEAKYNYDKDAAYSSGLLAMADSIYIKLYSSTNYKDFREFTA